MRKQFTIFLILVFVLGLIPINFSSAADLSNKLSGRILLQVEGVGQAWYIDPGTKQRAFLGRPADAFQIMRELGLGISEKDYNTFNGFAPKNLSGRILLRVEANGEAYYANPTDLKMYYLGRPADAFKVMREKGLGITDEDLTTVPIFQKYKEQTEANTSAPKATEPTTSTGLVPVPGVNYDKYKNPVTGTIMTPTEYIDYYDKMCASQDKVRSTTINSDGTISCITYTQVCQAKFGINSYSTGKNSSGTNVCNCTAGYAYDSNDKCVVIDYNALCQTKYGINSYSTGKNSSGADTCGCKTGYNFNLSGTSCQIKQTTDYHNAPYRQDGNAYSPEQLNAMDCAWYGINCPTINVRILN